MEFEGERERSAEELAREERVKRLILGAVSRCGTCQRAYTVDDFAIIGHREHLWMVSVVCDGCHHQGFITVVIHGRTLARAKAAPALLPELTPAERARFAGATPVATDDLLDLHLFLEAFDGDFAALFGVGKEQESRAAGDDPPPGSLDRD